MNKFLVNLLLVTAISTPSISIYADDGLTYTVTLTESEDPENYDIDFKKHRSFTLPLICTISSHGINISNVDSADIISYDLNTERGENIASYTSAEDFISLIYRLNGTYEIRIHTDGYSYHGHITLSK
ncbi:MAG: hypothetical protein K2M13_00925 [Muribaculaceae bacterium]|nr:hypothetical protein [Muribaculaceae bacterium]